MNQAPHVAIVGATGAVGVEILSCLETRNFPVGSLKLLASARSAGKQVAFRGKMLTVEELTEKSFDGVDIALFSAGGGISLKFAPIAAAAEVMACISAWAVASPRHSTRLCPRAITAPSHTTTAPIGTSPFSAAACAPFSARRMK